jgi:hypothetical protein
MMVLPSYPVRPVQQYPGALVQGDLSLALVPMTDPADGWHYFRIEMLREHLLAVAVAAENRSADRSYLLARDSVKVTVNGTELLEPERGFPSRLAGPALLGLGALGAAAMVLVAPVLFAGFPLIIWSGFKESSNATVIRARLDDEALWRTTLSPGETAHGFAYFQIPDSLRGKLDAVASVELRPLPEGDAETFTLPFAFAVE